MQSRKTEACADAHAFFWERNMKAKETMKLSSNALTTLKDTLIFLGMDPDSEEVTASVKNNIAILINAASAYIETQTGREFGRRQRTEKYTGTGSQKLILNHYPIKEIKQIRDVDSGEVIEANAYYLEAEGKNGILHKDDGWPGRGYPGGLANDVNAFKKSIEVTYTAGYILPKDGTCKEPSDLPYDIQYAVWTMIQQKWSISASGADGLSAFSISDVSWTFDKTTSPVVVDAVNKYMRWSI